MKQTNRETGDVFEEEYYKDGEIKVKEVKVIKKYTDDDGNLHIITKPV